MYLVKHRGIYHARLWVHGRYVNRSTRTRNRREAEAWIRREAERLRRELIEQPADPSSKHLSVFQVEVTARYAASPLNTRQGMKYGLLHVRRILRDPSLRDITFAAVERFKRALPLGGPQLREGPRVPRSEAQDQAEGQPHQPAGAVHGGSVTKLQMILDHASVQTTMVYVHLTPEDLRAGIAELPSLPDVAPEGDPCLIGASASSEAPASNSGQAGSSD